MSDKRREKPITKEQYSVLLEAGVPYEGSVEGLGYVLKEVVVVAKRINKYNDRFLQLATVQICVADNTYHSMTQKNKERAKVREDSLKRERKKVEAKESFRALVKHFYENLIRDRKEERSKYELDLGLFESRISQNMLCMADVPGKLQNTEECKTYFSYYENVPYYNYDQGEIKEYEPNLGAKIEDMTISWKNFIYALPIKVVYGTIDDGFVWGTNAFPDGSRHLSGRFANTHELNNAGVGTALSLFPVFETSILPSKALNMGQYNKMIQPVTRAIPQAEKKFMLEQHNSLVRFKEELDISNKIMEEIILPIMPFIQQPDSSKINSK